MHCIVPARAGSRRLSCKNKLPLAEQPLFYWSVLAAQLLNLPVTVTTDDDDILDCCIRRKIGCIRRPPELAQGEPNSISRVIRHVVNQVGDPFVLLLQPSSPFRHLYHLRQAIKRWETNGHEQALVSGTRPGHCFHIVDNSLVMPCWRATGNFFILHADYMIPGKSLINRDTLYYMHEGYTTLDIDTADEMTIARGLVATGVPIIWRRDP